MEFISHTIAWCRGEIFEGRMFFLFGLVIFAISLLYWKTGSTPSAKAMFIPLLIVGILSMAAGLSLNFTNQHRIEEYQKTYSKNPVEFVKSEKVRTENFIKWYPYTMYSMSIIIMVGILLFLWLSTPRGRAIGLSLILLGFSVLVLDHFSQERAETYHQHIVNYLN